MREAKCLDSTPAPDMHRRGLLAGGGAALLAGVAIVTTAAQATAGEDAEILELCAEFHRLHGAVAAVGRDDDDGIEFALDQRWRVSHLIENIVPATDAGRRAKAAIGFVLLAEDPGDGSRNVNFAIAALREPAMVRDTPILSCSSCTGC
jgi:hypothetical protein